MGGGQNCVGGAGGVEFVSVPDCAGEEGMCVCVCVCVCVCMCVCMCMCVCVSSFFSATLLLNYG